MKRLIIILLLFLLQFNLNCVEKEFNANKIKSWPNGIIYYDIDDEFTSLEKKKIQIAMNTWERNCNIKFVQAKILDKMLNFAHIYEIIKSYRNASTVGYCELPSCELINIKQNVILHELGHGIGLTHEHQRYDRDFFITIFFENIMKRHLHINFDVIDNPLYIEEDYPYDYKSIMHYESDDFSKNGLMTIMPNFGFEIGGDKLTKTDIQKVNDIYGEK